MSSVSNDLLEYEVQEYQKVRDCLLECLDLFEDFRDDRVGHVRVGEEEGGLVFQGEPPGFLYGERSGHAD